MKQTAELIVLAHTRFGENSIVLHTLSEEYGRRSFLVRVSQRTAMALFLPLNILQAEITENPKSTLWTARNFVCLHPLNGLRNDLKKNTMALFMSEVLYRVVKEDMDEMGLTAWMKGQIFLLDGLESDFSNFHLLFLLSLCTILGFSPEPADLSPFAGEHYQTIEALITKPLEEALLIPMNGQARNETAESVLRYIEYHTESAVRIRSLAVLREIFA
ncbi:MAG: recombination protein O N-terminal domain-containing protein [Bacteroidales bacterium]|nr:recombination protein O N-terminal domain-containing protein [Bacteroidales bacterium]